MTRPSFVFLHALGMSAQEWRLVTERLAGHDCLALDLPGFGAAADEGAADVATMVDQVTAILRSQETPCILVGHSMGGKIATLVAARAKTDDSLLLAGLVLVAASPLSPEPMDEDRRAEMLGWVADGPIARADAKTFVDANTATRLPDALRDAAIADVMRSNRDAWRAWLERGSYEDWRETITRLDLPALIIAGGEDGDLGEDAQRRLNLPLFPHADLRVILGAAHLLPYERPNELADMLATFSATRLA